jgi:hypothetical protein
MTANKWANALWIVIFAMGAVCRAGGAGSGSAGEDGDFYVATGGSDANPGTADKPLATIDKARQAVREKLAGGAKGEIKVVIREGTYRLPETLTFGPEDSGSRDCPVVYAVYPGEDVVVSGGRRITGWEKAENGRWKAKTDLKDFRQLYINGVRGVRARQVLKGSEDWYGHHASGQNKGTEELEFFGEDGYRTKSAAMTKMADWPDAGGVEFHCVYVWCHTVCKVQSVRREGDYTIITMQQPQFNWARKKEGVHVNLPTYMENAMELLNEPGEWYLDRSAGVVYYQPRAGEDMAAAEVIAPALEKVVDLHGSLDEPVHDIRFSGITFAHGSWNWPSERGLVDVQANVMINPEGLLDRKDGLTNVHNEHLKSPANIICHTGRNIRFENCMFTRLGGAGIDIEAGSQDNQIVGCQFRDIAGSGIQIGDVLREDHHPKDVRSINRNNQVLKSLIERCAADYMGSVGIFVGYTEGTVLEENEIRDLPYSGISMGWGWGEEDAGGGSENYYQPFKYDTPTPAKNNRIEYNHVHHVMQKMDDGGSIYMLGNQPGTVIRGNRVHDNGGRPGGIYLDEGSGFIEVSGNGVERVFRAINLNNRTQNRDKTCVLKDNACKEDFTIYADKEYYASFPEIILNKDDVIVYFERQKLSELRASELHPHYQPASHIYYAIQSGRDWTWRYKEESPKLTNVTAATRTCLALPEGEILDMRYRYIGGTKKIEHYGPMIFKEAIYKNQSFQGPIDEPGPCLEPAIFDIKRLADGSLLAAAHGCISKEQKFPLIEGEAFQKQWPEGYRTPSIIFLKGTADGRHWRYLSHIENRHAFEFNEPAIAVFPDGRIIVMIRTDWSKAFRDIMPKDAGNDEEVFGYYMYQSESLDGGKTWSEPVRLPIWGHPANLVQLKSGNLLMVYGYRQKQQGFRAVLSRDQGRTWDLKTMKSLKVFEPGSYDLGYPVAVELGDMPEGRIFCCGYGYSTSDVGEKQPHGIFGCIFNEEWLSKE